jgi:hypothetical protein
VTSGVSIEPATLHVDGLAPGGTETRMITVRNDSGSPVVVTPQQDDDGELLTGPAPVAVTYRWDGAARSCDGDPVVGAGERVDLTLVASMPADAGDEYQGASGASTLTLAAVQHVDAACPPGGGSGQGGGGGAGGTPGTGGVLAAAPPGGSDLALTGAQAGGLLLTAALLVATGVRLVRARRRWSAGAGAS